MDLVQFLRDRLAETEAAVLRYRDGHEGPCINFKGQDPKHYSEYDSCALHLEAAEATPYRDAAFGLAEVEAKRRLIERGDTLFCECDFADSPPTNPEDRSQQIPHHYDCTAYRIAQVLALPYAGHPDFQQDWKP